MQISLLQKDINIQARKGQTYSIWDYYQKINEFDRVGLDSFSFDTGVLPIRTLPIVVQNDEQKLFHLMTLLNQFKLICTQSRLPMRCCKSRKNFGIFYDPIFGSHYQMTKILQSTFDGEQFYLETTDKKSKLDCMLFTGNSLKRNDADPNATYKRFPTFILCSPNAMVYQHMVNQPHAFYLRYFLNKSINILTWNYRGYGLSTGQPSLRNINQDAEQILNYLKNQMGITGKFGVYGRSLGGIPTSYLQSQVDFIYADRTLSNFDLVAERKFYSVLAKFLFKVGSWGWTMHSEKNFLQKSNQAKKCYKVLLADERDDVIDINSSLMIGIAKELLLRSNAQFKFLMNNRGLKMKQFIKSLRFIVDLEYFLSQTIDYQSINQYDKSLSETVANNDNENLKQSSLSSSVITQCKISPQDNKDHDAEVKIQYVSDMNQIKIKFKENSDTKMNHQNINNLLYLLQIQDDKDLIEIDDFYIEVYMMLSNVINQFSRMQAGCYTFSDNQLINREEAGNVIRVNCGHTGIPSLFEVTQMDAHLQNSQFTMDMIHKIN
ncbi:UNKNOWN [Stylonychia lemnae]|uniref:Serine aminopeptidase S33 domain-containing protein n=1 Tax=Stylonychia lemnae TaxID=5949 RepID=A0A078AQZ8_STYLE|nr:UNKNOWN [Stylonychia lemnae]|eukprot:CDW84644.1 UNKNOWN [Stylonychia lemnae]